MEPTSSSRHGYSSSWRLRLHIRASGAYSIARMPRLTNSDYLSTRLFLARIWEQSDGRAMAVLPGYAHRDLHDFFAFSVPLSEACQCPIRTARGRPAVLPAGGQGNCPVMANRSAHRGFGGVGHDAVVRGQLIVAAPFPARAWASRIESPVVWQTWVWCMSRSTVAVAKVFGISSSNPDGCRFEKIAMDRFS